LCHKPVFLISINPDIILKKFNMKRYLLLIALCSNLILMLFSSCKQPASNNTSRQEQVNTPDKYDLPAELAREEFEKTKDPELGYVPTERLMTALEYARQSRISQLSLSSTPWQERGPTTDTAGPSGNSRPNNDMTSGRIRALCVDLSDPTGNTVWTGGVAGGLWKTTNINVRPSNWTLINDFFANLAVTGICQNPANTQELYFCTGEAFFNFDAVRGLGVWKSSNGGVTWTQLPSTSTYQYCTRIACDASGNVYMGVRGIGLLRSTNGGSTWTNITPSGLNNDISDIRISSTGRMHVTSGIFSTTGYRFTDIPATVTSATWTSSTTPLPASSVRIELACKGNTLLALPSNGAFDITTLYKSTDGGANWVATGTTPSFTSGQAWYCVAADIDPENPLNMIVGSLDCFKTTDGGATWTKISTWASLSGQYVHADQHNIIWQTSNRIIFACDGGIHYTSNGGTTIRDRNAGLRLKQFFSVAIHPSANYFLAGAQDNGSHRMRNIGLGGSVEVTGGDGAFVHIDQNEPQIQFTSFVRNQYRRSIDGGNSWVSVNLSSSTGQFINPTDYDDVNNHMYCGNSSGTYRRWLNASSGNTNETVVVSNMPGSVTAVTVSPFTANTVYLGTNSGSTIMRIDNANTFASNSAGTLIATGVNTGVVSCINTGTNDNNLIISSSSYGVQQVWITSNGGTSWTNVDGNLPDMPVRWCMFAPGNNNKAILATETGIWTTSLLNGASTVWVADPFFPPVRTDMLQYRAADNAIAAATHGRGIWTQSLLLLLPTPKVTLQGQWMDDNQVQLDWKYTDPVQAASFEIEAAAEGGGSFAKVGKLNYNGNSYTFRHRPTTLRMFYRVKVIMPNGSTQYSNPVLLRGRGRNSELELVNLYPNPAESQMQIGYQVPGSGMVSLDITSTDGKRWLHREEKISSAGLYSRTLEVQSLPAGVYILTIQQNGGLRYRRFVKK
jgi:trimeric autotransporter adhesin